MATRIYSANDKDQPAFLARIPDAGAYCDSAQHKGLMQLSPLLCLCCAKFPCFAGTSAVRGQTPRLAR